MPVLPFEYFTKSPSAATLLNTIIGDGGVSVETSRTYGRHARHRLDIYRPRKTHGPSPVVMFLYGGGWDSGARSMYGFAGAALASKGVTTVIPDYRLYPNVKFPSFCEDAALAYAWTRKHIAKSRPVIIAGHSAGAHIGALVCLDRRYLKQAGENKSPAGFIGLAGPYSFDPTTWPSTKRIFDSARSADETRPVAFAGAHSPPMLLMHGLDDSTVKLFNQRGLAEALRSHGVSVQTAELPDIGHVGLVLALSRPLRWRGPVLSSMLSFVKGTTAAG